MLAALPCGLDSGWKNGEIEEMEQITCFCFLLPSHHHEAALLQCTLTLR